jgi:hypothetical protein
MDTVSLENSKKQKGIEIEGGVWKKLFSSIKILFYTVSICVVLYIQRDYCRVKFLYPLVSSWIHKTV